MTGADRQHLKQLVDYHRRQRIQADDQRRLHPYGTDRCRGCGTELENRTRGCRPCHDRARQRRRKQRNTMFDGRCKLCGQQAYSNGYCGAHGWAAA